jgi:adenine-specific DNA methylase
MVAYKCCKKAIAEHPLNSDDLAQIHAAQSGAFAANGWFPTTPLPDGANLNQPKRHGLTSIDRFYSPRNLAALSHLWREINHVKDDEIAGFLAFTFTSLYQRVTRLSEFRFWGGSGNTAHFNVPQIFNESNVFLTFERKARTIADHLQTTAAHYAGDCIVHTGSATDLSFLPDASIDLIFTDPPFGANINYSEMNVLWESWLGERTDPTHEAIVSKPQNKDVADYQKLMTDSLRECHRVLRDNHWMVVVFMISSEPVWKAIRAAIVDSGFEIERVDVFDKQHGTFKHFVSQNTAGADLMIHCRKRGMTRTRGRQQSQNETSADIATFIHTRDEIPRTPYLHVSRRAEIDYRMLYSEFLSEALVKGGATPNFAEFRRVAQGILRDVNEADSGQSVH